MKIENTFKPSFASITKTIDQNLNLMLVFQKAVGKNANNCQCFQQN